MKVLVLGGAGAMGMVTTRDLAESNVFDEVVIGDIDTERMQRVRDWIASEKVSIEKADLSNPDKLVQAMEKADVVANAATYHLNLAVTKAAIQAKRNLTDLGGVYYMTLKQMQLNREAETAGVAAVIGAGVAPGTADVLAKYGADKLDRVSEVHIHYGDVNLEPVKYKWAFRTVLEEYTQGPVIFKDGEFKALTPFSGKHVFRFPDPVNERPCCYALYSGIASLPSTIGKGVKLVDCSMSYVEEDEQRIRILTEMGLTNPNPVQVQGIQVVPREVLVSCAPPPDVRVQDVASIVVEVNGEKAGEQVKYTYSLVFGHHKRYGVSATAYLTGVPMSIVSQMLAQNKIEKKGVLPTEAAVNPGQFFAELAKRGVAIYETQEKTRTL